MAFCTQCGAQLEEGAKFCTNCGARQPEASVPPAAEQPVYTPPAASAAPQTQSYSYDPTIEPSRNGGGKKKGGKLVFIILAALVVIAALLFIFLGRGGSGVSADDPMLGLYTAQKAESNGVNISIKTMWSDGFSIELQSKGKAALNIDGTKGSAKWTLDGEAFTLKGSGVDCSGTLVDGVLTLEDVMGTGVKLYFTKDGAALPTAETPKPAASSEPEPSSEPVPSSEPAPSSEPEPSSEPAPAPVGDMLGVYNADKAEAYGVEVPISTMWEKGFSIELQDGGVCLLTVNGTGAKGSWSLDGETISVDVPGFAMDGTLADGVLTLENIYGMGVTLFFTRDGSLAPAPQPTDSYAWWDGDWYGWWYISDAGGVYKEYDYIGYDWAACATIDVENGMFNSWDEDDDLVAYGTVSFSEGLTGKGCMSNVSTHFWDYEMSEGEWNCDPGNAANIDYPNTIIIFGHYDDPDDDVSWFDYTIFLRPWGERWDGFAEGLLPDNYESWYLPLIEAGESMPESFEGLN